MSTRTHRLAPAEARAQIDDAAREVAKHPYSWKQIVRHTRQSIGFDASIPEGLCSGSLHVVRTETEQGEAWHPIEEPEVIGKGGFSTVHRTTELFSGRQIILRTATPQTGSGLHMSVIEEAWKKQRVEILPERLRTLRRNPIIQRYLGRGEHLRPDQSIEPCEVYEMAPGKSLKCFFREHGLTHGQLLDVCWHGARGLDAIHRSGYIHADVKPDNFCISVWSDAEGARHTVVRLIDFGTLSTVREQVEEIVLGTQFAGTLLYMPPELFEGSIPLNEGTVTQMVQSRDVYSLGVTLTRLVGELPEVLLEGDITKIVEFKRDVDDLGATFSERTPAELQELIRRMIHRDWQRRPSMVQVIDETRAMRERLPIEERDRLLVGGEPGSRAVLFDQVPPPSERIGPYRIVNRSYQLRLATGEEPLALLEDRYGRKFIGVPVVYTDPEKVQKELVRRTALLEDLNGIRKKHPALFPGTFRDIVREGRPGKPPSWAIWMIRPFLHNKHNLGDYLKRIEPRASLTRRIGILRHVAESLAALEEGGYHHPGVLPERVFFVGEMGGDDSTEPSHYHQELMDTARIRKIDPETEDITVRHVEILARVMKVSLGIEMRSLKTWRERAQYLATLREETTMEI